MNFSNYPLLKILIPYVFGLLLGYLVPLPTYFCHFSFFIAACFWLLSLFFRQETSDFWRTIKTLFLWLIFIFAGLSAMTWRMMPSVTADEERVMAGEEDWIVEVVEVPETRARSVRATAQVLGGARGSSFREKVLLYLAPDSLHPIHYGDLLLVHTQLNAVEEPKNPDMFDYRSYLHKRGISLTGYVAKGGAMLLSHRTPDPLKVFSQQIQNRLAGLFRQSGMSGREYEIITAILLGAGGNLDPELRQSYAAAGVSHILCVSGMHVGVIFMILNFLMKPMELARQTRAVKAILLILTIWLYACITGLSPSVIRSATMFSFVTIGGIVHRNTNIFHSLTASLFILLIINPLLLFEVGFQLSYLAVFGIVLFQPLIVSIYHAKTKIGRYLFELISVSIAAQLGTFPISIFYFGQFPNYFIFSNLSVITLSSVVIITGIVLLVTSFIPFLVKGVALILTGEIRLMNNIIGFIEQLPHSVTDNIDYHYLQVIFLYVAIFGFYLLIIHKRKHWFWITLSAFTLFSGCFAIKKVWLTSSDEMVIYQIRGVSAIGFRDGNECVFLSDSIKDLESSLFEYNIGNHYRKQHAKYIFVNVDSSKYCNDFVYKNGRFICFKKSKYFLLKKNEKIYPAIHPIEVDGIILQYNPRQLPEEVSRGVHFRSIIMDGTVTPFYRKRWQNVP
ncbi:MAG: competence protein ComEC family protein [Bacteroidales bacterium]|nr:competence protein ComEC family protein [Bacteroidales bacterium]